MGRTDSFKTTIIPAGTASIGDVVDVQIEDAHGATLFARTVDGVQRRAAAG